VTDATTTPAHPPLTVGVVLRVTEEACEIRDGGTTRSVGYARMFPTPHVERVAPGNLVAVAPAADGTDVVVWRWYDAVVLGECEGEVLLWEPFHGEVTARPRPAYDAPPIGSRAWLSAGLPGADWWVGGRVCAEPAVAVDLDEVVGLYNEHDLWGSLT
jgi:hypothetical protein